jgi:CDP-diacylglycerol---glycerol-3-phosphate 3-phosphatidyltransferase
MAPSTGSARAGSASAWNIATAFTGLRLALVPVFGWLLLHDGGGHSGFRAAALAVFAAAVVTDRFDGDLARRRGLVTDFGAVVDPIADKALTGMAFLGLSLLGDLSWWVTSLVLVREVGVTVLRFWVIRHGVIPASRGGKAKTVLQFLALVGYILPLTGWLHDLAAGVMAAAVVVTLATGIDYVARAYVVRRDGRAARQAAG